MDEKQQSSAALTGKVLETENLIETYTQIAEWIRFADAKAAVVLTAGGALASVLIPTFKSYIELHSGQLADQPEDRRMHDDFVRMLIKILALTPETEEFCVKPIGDDLPNE